MVTVVTLASATRVPPWQEALCLTQWAAGHYVSQIVTGRAGESFYDTHLPLLGSLNQTLNCPTKISETSQSFPVHDSHDQI